MRYNIEDFRKGNISEERLREIVEKVIYKIDPKIASNEDVNRIISSLRDSAEKMYQYVRQESITLDEVNAELHELKEFNNATMLLRIAHYNYWLQELKIAVAYAQMQELALEQADALDRRRHEAAELDAIERANEEAELQALEEIRALEAEFEQLRLEVQQLEARRQNLEDDIDRINDSIKVSRYEAIEDTIQHMDEIEFEGVKTFEGMTDENKRKFVEGWYEIDEIATRNTVEIDLKIEANEKKMAEIQAELNLLLSQQNKGSVMQMYDRQAARNPERNARIAELQKDFREYKHKNATLLQQKDAIPDIKMQKIRELGDVTQCQHINTSVDDDTLLNHLNAYEENPNIKNNIVRHREHVIEAHTDITHKRKEIKSVNNTISAKQELIHKKQARVDVVAHTVQHTKQSVDGIEERVDDIEQREVVVRANNLSQLLAKKQTDVELKAAPEDAKLQSPTDVTKIEQVQETTKPIEKEQAIENQEIDLSSTGVDLDLSDDDYLDLELSDDLTLDDLPDLDLDLDISSDNKLDDLPDLDELDLPGFDVTADTLAITQQKQVESEKRLTKPI